MPMAADDQSKSWNTKNYILAALGGTLAATAVVIIVSVILSPARINFSVAHASKSNSPDGTGMYLNLTIAANNTSRRRASVKYESVFVDLKNSTSPAGKDTTPAHIETTLPTEYLPGGRVANINAWIFLVGGSDLVQSFAGHRNDTVVVTSQVRFKIWLSRTRLYDIDVSCPGVIFQPANETSPPVSCNNG